MTWERYIPSTTQNLMTFSGNLHLHCCTKFHYYTAVTKATVTKTEVQIPLSPYLAWNFTSYQEMACFKRLLFYIGVRIFSERIGFFIRFMKLDELSELELEPVKQD